MVTSSSAWWARSPYLSGALMLGLLLGSVSTSLLLHAAGPVPALLAPTVGTLAGLALMGTVPRDEPSAEVPAAGRVDWAGSALLSAGLVLAVLALHQGTASGWTAPATLTCLGTGLLLVAAWAALQLRSATPLIDIRRLFRPRLLPVFAVGCCVNFVVIGGHVSYTAYLTDRGGLGLKPAAAGLVLLPAFGAMAASSALTSRFGRVAGFRRVTVTGAALLVAGTMVMLLRPSTAVEVAAALTLAGTGLGLITGATRVLVIDGVRVEETAAPEGLFELLVSLGIATGSATTAAILAAQDDNLPGYRTVWTVGAGVALLGLAAALCLPRPAGKAD
ncbi:MFS transporter [Streptomyces sp. NPDC101160]|uniref:MFS transporter n=1 Tax=Streptomyces sp. NPDC101160 TaxID=3366118 RepID=UPI00380B2529